MERSFSEDLSAVCNADGVYDPFSEPGQLWPGTLFACSQPYWLRFCKKISHFGTFSTPGFHSETLDPAVHIPLALTVLYSPDSRRKVDSFEFICLSDILSSFLFAQATGMSVESISFAPANLEKLITLLIIFDKRGYSPSCLFYLQDEELDLLRQILYEFVSQDRPLGTLSDHFRDSRISTLDASISPSSADFSLARLRVAECLHSSHRLRQKILSFLAELHPFAFRDSGTLHSLLLEFRSPEPSPATSGIVRSSPISAAESGEVKCADAGEGPISVAESGEVKFVDAEEVKSVDAAEVKSVDAEEGQPCLLIANRTANRRLCEAAGDPSWGPNDSAVDTLRQLVVFDKPTEAGVAAPGDGDWDGLPPEDTSDGALGCGDVSSVAQNGTASEPRPGDLLELPLPLFSAAIAACAIALDCPAVAPPAAALAEPAFPELPFADSEILLLREYVPVVFRGMHAADAPDPLRSLLERAPGVSRHAAHPNLFQLLEISPGIPVELQSPELYWLYSKGFRFIPHLVPGSPPLFEPRALGSSSTQGRARRSRRKGRRPCRPPFPELPPGDPEILFQDYVPSAFRGVCATDTPDPLRALLERVPGVSRHDRFPHLYRLHGMSPDIPAEVQSPELFWLWSKGLRYFHHLVPGSPPLFAARVLGMGGARGQRGGRPGRSRRLATTRPLPGASGAGAYTPKTPGPRKRSRTPDLWFGSSYVREYFWSSTDPDSETEEWAISCLISSLEGLYMWRAEEALDQGTVIDREFEEVLPPRSSFHWCGPTSPHAVRVHFTDFATMNWWRDAINLDKSPDFRWNHSILAFVDPSHGQLETEQWSYHLTPPQCARMPADCPRAAVLQAQPVAASVPPLSSAEPASSPSASVASSDATSRRRVRQRTLDRGGPNQWKRARHLVKQESKRSAPRAVQSGPGAAPEASATASAAAGLPPHTAVGGAVKWAITSAPLSNEGSLAAEFRVGSRSGRIRRIGRSENRTIILFEHPGCATAFRELAVFGHLPGYLGGAITANSVEVGPALPASLQSVELLDIPPLTSLGGLDWDASAQFELRVVAYHFDFHSRVKSATVGPAGVDDPRTCSIARRQLARYLKPFAMHLAFSRAESGPDALRFVPKGSPGAKLAAMQAFLLSHMLSEKNGEVHAWIHTRENAHIELLAIGVPVTLMQGYVPRDDLFDIAQQRHEDSRSVPMAPCMLSIPASPHRVVSPLVEDWGLSGLSYLPRGVSFASGLITEHTLPGLRPRGEFWDELYYTDIVCASPQRLSLGVWADRLRDDGHPGMYLRVLYPWGDDGFPWELIVDSIINLIASEPGIQVLPPPDSHRRILDPVDGKFVAAHLGVLWAAPTGQLRSVPPPQLPPPNGGHFHPLPLLKLRQPFAPSQAHVRGLLKLYWWKLMDIAPKFQTVLREGVPLDAHVAPPCLASLRLLVCERAFCADVDTDVYAEAALAALPSLICVGNAVSHLDHLGQLVVGGCPAICEQYGCCGSAAGNFSPDNLSSGTLGRTALLENTAAFDIYSSLKLQICANDSAVGAPSGPVDNPWADLECRAAAPGALELCASSHPMAWILPPLGFLLLADPLVSLDIERAPRSAPRVRVVGIPEHLPPPLSADDLRCALLPFSRACPNLWGTGTVRRRSLGRSLAAGTARLRTPDVSGLDVPGGKPPPTGSCTAASSATATLGTEAPGAELSPATADDVAAVGGAATEGPPTGAMVTRPLDVSSDTDGVGPAAVAPAGAPAPAKAPVAGATVSDALPANAGETDPDPGVPATAPPATGAAQTADPRGHPLPSEIVRGSPLDDVPVEELQAVDSPAAPAAVPVTGDSASDAAPPCDSKVADQEDSSSSLSDVQRGSSLEDEELAAGLGDSPLSAVGATPLKGDSDEVDDPDADLLEGGSFSAEVDGGAPAGEGHARNTAL